MAHRLDALKLIACCRPTFSMDGSDALDTAWLDIVMEVDLLDRIRDGALITSTDWLVLAANERAAEIFECSCADLIGSNFEFIGEPGVMEEVALDTCLGRKFMAEVEAQEISFRGETAYLIFIRDVTHQKDIERRLNLLDRAVESSVNGILIVDAFHEDMPIIYVNSTFESITGYSAAEAIGQNCRFLQGQDRDQPGVEKIRLAIQNRESCHVELRNYRKNGELFWNELSISPVHDRNGAVTHFLGIMTDITERKTFEEERQYNKFHDSLTGLANRALVETVIESAIPVALNRKTTMAVFFIDIDHFKPINDSLGHKAGDQVLVEIARRMSDQLLRADTIARVAGDEFVIVVKDLADSNAVIPIVEKVLKVFEAPVSLETAQEVYVTGSVGIAVLNGHNHSAEQLIQEADIAMYRAKQLGRNTYQFYAEGLETNYRHHVQMKTELQAALINGEFFLEYQPKVDLHSGNLSGFEALVRWRHPERGIVPPNEFIDTAEETGLIVPIGRWVLEEAVRFNHCLIQEGICDVPVAVNVSGLQFMRERFTGEVDSVLRRYGLPANRLELEFTESIMMDSDGDTIRKLEALSALGVQLSIDDFGTGYSSLSYLKSLPINRLKIDASFVREVTDNSRDAGIVLAIISIAHNLGISVIAEGIEKNVQLLYLARNQCDEGQGYLLSRPLNEERLRAALAEGTGFWMPETEEEDDRATLLLVDDEPNILRALTRVLRRDGYRILTAGGAHEALDKLAANKVQVIISDQRMPDMSGTELLSKVKEMYPDTVRIVLSGYTELQTVTDAINRGAIYRFLTKPWEDEQIRSNVRDAFRHHARTHSEQSGGHVVSPPTGRHLALVGNH